VTSIGELEATLQTPWDDETAAVHADDLGWEDDHGNDIELAFDAVTLLVALEALDDNRRCTSPR
jgi:hypothetical protein